MRSISFKLLFDGDEQSLQQGTYEVSGLSKTIRFKTEQLHDISELEGRLDRGQLDDLHSYFGFSGFSLYYIESDHVIFLILYREHQQRHQIYERGFIEV